MPGPCRSATRRATSGSARRRRPRRAPSPQARAAGARAGAVPPGAFRGRSAPARARKALALGKKLFLREGEEAVLVGPDLMEIDVRVARLVVLLDLVEVFVGIGSERQRSVELVRFPVLDELLEVARQRQLL